MVEIRGGKAVRSVMGQEFSKLSSNAVSGLSQKICGTHSLRLARDKADHKALRSLIGVPLSPSAVADAVPNMERVCRNQIASMMMQGRGEEVIIAADVTEAMALDITWQQILGLDLKTQ